MSILVLLLAVLACVICQAFFSASEIALVAADDLKVHAERERGDRRAVVLGELLQRRDRVVAMLLTGTNLATVIAAAALTSFLHALSPRAAYLAPFILAPVSLLLGESIPKMAAVVLTRQGRPRCGHLCRLSRTAGPCYPYSGFGGPHAGCLPRSVRRSNTLATRVVGTEDQRRQSYVQPD